MAAVSGGFNCGFTTSSLMSGDGFGTGFFGVQTFSPLSLGSDLALWLDATDTSTLYTDSTEVTLSANGAFIGRWKDKSGNNRHADKGSVGTARPVRTDGSINSKTGVNFSTGGIPGLFIPYNVSNPTATSISGGTKFEIWAVYTSVTAGNNHVFTTYEGSGVNYVVMWTTAGFGTYVAGHHVGWIDSSVIRDSGYASARGPAVVHRGIIDTTLSSGTVKNIVNNFPGSATSGADTAGGGVSTQTRVWYVGADKNGTFQNKASVGEIIYVTRHLTETEASGMTSYLKNKWGIL